MLKKSSISLRRGLLLHDVAELQLSDVHGEDGGEEKGLKKKVRQKTHHSDETKLLQNYSDFNISKSTAMGFFLNGETKIDFSSSRNLNKKLRKISHLLYNSLFVQTLHLQMRFFLYF